MAFIEEVLAVLAMSSLQGGLASLPEEMADKDLL